MPVSKLQKLKTLTGSNSEIQLAYILLLFKMYKDFFKRSNNYVIFYSVWLLGRDKKIYHSISLNLKQYS